METKLVLLQHIKKDWSESPQAKICEEILEYLISYKNPEKLHLTYGIIKKILSNGYSDIHILQALQYLSGDRVPLLKSKFEMIDDCGDEYLLDDEDVAVAQKTGVLFHPEKEEVVEDFENKVFIYFIASDWVRANTVS
ncbi:MAG: hypothetical protein F6J87_06195 [Spirulina sp. SIO3F2]|nr:hypothetical protein [Spirulina sp. SIO3F2]